MHEYNSKEVSVWCRPVGVFEFCSYHVTCILFFLVMAFMQEFPNEGIATVVRNVFDFDSFHPELLEVVFKVLHKHGIPVGASANAVQLAPE